MKIHFLKSASVIIESKGIRILCDPWLIDGEYFGSWNHYPPYEFRNEDFRDINYIYISHIHQDHCSLLTLERLNKDIPVLIHRFAAPFLKSNIQNLGFKVQELPHNKRTHLQKGLYINILAADDCDPEICLKFFGCGIYNSGEGSAQIDTLAVFDDGEFTIVNVNDSPLKLAYSASSRIQQMYPRIDFLLVGYAGAGPFPQCFPQYSDDQKAILAKDKKFQFLNQALEYLEELKPRFFMPFAGTYTLGGNLSDLNKFRGVPEVEEALDYLVKQRKYDGKGILLNSNSFFDLEKEESSEEYKPAKTLEKEKYIEEVLSKVLFSYEHLPVPELMELEQLISYSYERMDKKRISIGYSSPTKVQIPLVESKCVIISMRGEGYTLVDNANVVQEQFVKLKVDPRLLHLLLLGPKFAHWQNAEIGSHIEYSRQPDTFERGLYYCMNFFHS